MFVKIELERLELSALYHLVKEYRREHFLEEGGIMGELLTVKHKLEDAVKTLDDMEGIDYDD